MKIFLTFFLLLLSFALAGEGDFLGSEARERWQSALKAMDEASSAEQYDNIMKMIPGLPNPFRLQSDYLDLSKQPKIQVSTANHADKMGFKLVRIEAFSHPVYQSHASVEHFNSQILPHLQKLFARVSSAQKTVTINFKAKAEKGWDGHIFLYWEPSQLLGGLITPFLRETKGEFAAVLLKPLEKFDFEGLRFGAGIPLEVTLYAIPKKYESLLKIAPPNGNFCDVDTAALLIRNEHRELVGSLYCERRIPEHTWLLPLRNAIVFSPFSISDHKGDCQPGYKDRLSDNFIFGGDLTLKSSSSKFSVTDTKLGEDYLAVTYMQLIDRLYEKKLLPSDYEQELRNTMDHELHWAYGREILGNAIDSYAAPQNVAPLFISSQGLSPEELTICCLAQRIAYKVCTHLMGLDPDSPHDFTDEQHNKIQYAQAHLAITALNLVGAGPRSEKALDAKLRSDQAKDQIGTWDPQRHLLDLSGSSSAQGANDSPRKEANTAAPQQGKPEAQQAYTPAPYWLQELEGIDQASTERQYELLLTAFAQKLPAPFEQSAEILSQPTATLKSERTGKRLILGDAEVNIYTSDASLKYYNEHIFPRLHKLLAHFSRAELTEKMDFHLKSLGRLSDDLSCSPEEALAPHVNHLLNNNKGTFVVALARPLCDHADCSGMAALPMEVHLYALPVKYEKLFREKDVSINRYSYVAFNVVTSQKDHCGSLYYKIYNDWKLKMEKGYAFMPLAQALEDGVNTADSVYVYTRSFIPSTSYSLLRVRTPFYGVHLEPVQQGMDYLTRLNTGALGLLYTYSLLPPDAYDKLMHFGSDDIQAYASWSSQGESSGVIAAPFDGKSSCILSSGWSDEMKTVVWVAEQIAYKTVTHLTAMDASTARMKAEDRDMMVKVAQARLAVTLLNLSLYKQLFGQAFTDKYIVSKYSRPRAGALIGKWDKQHSILDLSQAYKGVNEGSVPLIKSDFIKKKQ